MWLKNLSLSKKIERFFSNESGTPKKSEISFFLKIFRNLCKSKSYFVPGIKFNISLTDIQYLSDASLDLELVKIDSATSTIGL